MMIIDKREKKIEEIRNKNLEAFYTKNIELSPENMMNLGLNMYVKNIKYIRRELYNVFNQSLLDDEKVLHSQQAEVLKILMDGNNLLLSAPTSFGKTFIALEYMKRKSFSNVVFVVPTLALMNELSVKIRKNFGKDYNIITNSFETFKKNNIFILVPERIDNNLLNEIDNITIDLLVFDEIYKLKRKNVNDKKNNNKRLIALNKGYFDMVNKSNQIILLGPFIKEINFNRTKLDKDIVKYYSDYAPVYIKTLFIEDNKDIFIKNKIKNKGNKLIYFDSPASIYKFCSSVELKTNVELNNSLTSWCDKYISADWLPSKMLKKGIGIHHGNIPAFMRRYVENLYNEKKIVNMLCTSTLLEGINTPTEQLIIYDSNLSAFQVNNLIGRVGRLDTFKKGLVYYFDEKLEQFIIGDEKYETIEIVAESNEIEDIEELIYLEKDKLLLNDKNLKKLQDLENKLNKYNKSIEQLKKTDGFTVKSLILFLDNIDNLFEKLKKLSNAINSEDVEEKKKATNFRNDIVKMFMKIIPDKKAYYVAQINAENPNKINSSVCVNSLLVLQPNNIYSKINRQIIKNKERLPNDKLNMFVDYLFYLAFGYIKYDLSKIVKYCDFIFDDEYIKTLTPDKIRLVELLKNEILKRFELFNSEDNKIIKILLDIGIPYTDAVKIEKKIKSKLDADNISTGKIYDVLEENKEILKQKADLDNITKELLDIIVQ